MEIALVVYDGVLDDECEAFRSVLGLLTDARFRTVAANAGTIRGVGGQQIADCTFDQIDRVDVVVVPGGLGCERVADDPELREFLHRMEHSSRLLAASSTGTVVLASAGLLHGGAAATHWLASDLLRRYGSESDARRLVVAGNIITCEGRISAVSAAFAIAERLEGSEAVERIRATLIERGQPLLRDPRWWERLAERWLGRASNDPAPTDSSPLVNAGTSISRATARAVRRGRDHVRDQPAPGTKPPVTPLSVMVELVDNDDLARQMKRSANRRRRGT